VLQSVLKEEINVTTILRKSNDPVRQVAAFLVVGETIYVGINEIPEITMDNHIWGNREAVRILATHAEVNAVRAALADGITDFSQTTLYVSLHPCEQCMRMIQAIGISHVYYNEDYIPSRSTVDANTTPVNVSKLR
jgi:deoxycytidylate deaminase